VTELTYSKDDIFPSLGTIPDPTATDLAFEASVRAEWSSFIHTGAPTSAWSAWTTASTTGNVYNLGNNGTIRDCSSAPGAFGSAQNPWWWDVYSSAVVEPLGAGVGY
jgi:hypothetical protein